MKHATHQPLVPHLQGGDLTTTTRPSRTKRLFIASRCALFAAPLCVACPAAFALDDDVFVVGVSASERYDQNLFSLPDGTDPPGNGRRSGLTRQTGFDLRFDKAYGQQKFDVYANATHLQYNPYDNLDFTSYGYGASWAWTFTPELNGHVSVSESKAPNSFSDTGFETNPNPRTQQTRLFDINYRPGATLHPRLSIVQSEDKSAQTTIERQNAQTNSVEGALVYEFRSLNTADIYFRRGRGHYFDLDLDPTSLNDSQFDENESGVEAHYTADGASTFDGRIGYFSRKHRNFEQRDFSGVVAQLGYTYIVTGKTRVQFSLFRSLSASQTAITSYVRDQGFSIAPDWAATAKISVRPSFSITNRDFRGSVTQGSQDLTMHLRNESLEVTWEALRALTLAASVFHAERTSSYPAFQYTNRGATISARLHF